MICSGNRRLIFILFYACCVYIFMNGRAVVRADAAAGDGKAGASMQSVLISRGRMAAYDGQEERVLSGFHLGVTTLHNKGSG